MTSVGVVWSAVERMKCLRNPQMNTGSLPKEADGLLNDLEEIQGLLAAAYARGVEPGAKLEKEVVRISYDVVYTITDTLKAATGIFDRLMISGSNSKLEKLKVQLQSFKEELKQKVNPDQKQKVNLDQTAGLVPDPDSSAASSPVEKAGAKIKPKERHFGIPIRMNSGILCGGRKAMDIGDKVMEKKPESTTGLEIQEEDMSAGSDERPADQSMPGPKINEEERTDLLNRLKSVLMSKISEDNPREMYIMGKSGMGKSTLVSELYNDPEIRNFFKVFGWVTVGHNFRIKGVLQHLLKQLGPWQEDQQQEQLDLREMNEIELISQIFDVVEDKSYLLVLEDIGSMQDWKIIRLALPLAPLAKSTRVIITTCSKDFSSRPQCHEILGLTLSETLVSLNTEASFDPEVGEAVYDISGGSPLYTTILAKSLKLEANNKNLVKELRAYESKKGTHHVLGACYKRLPPELKPCFLYLGQFPPRHDIPVDELYLLLAAENLIMPQAGNAEMSPQTLSGYLEKLADLKLVQVEEDPRSETKFYKSCLLQDQVREFCNSQGLDEEFHLIVDFQRLKQVVEPHTHRLAIYMNKYKGDATFSFKGNDTARKILSLLIFDTFDSAEERPRWPSEMDDLSAFAHLRILIFEEVNFKLRRLPRGLEKLNPLRFLSFRGCFLEELPSSLSSLKQLETLDLRVRDDCNVIILSNVFASMKRMVHLYLPSRYQNKGKNKLTLQGLEMLETLTNFNTEVFKVADLSQFKRLKELSTVSSGLSPKDIDSVVTLLNERKEGLQHSSVEVKSFDCYDQDNISALRKLLQCRFVRSVKVEGQIEKGQIEELLVEEGGGGGDRVVDMFLECSELETDPMEYFQKFQNLRSLVLANDAFIEDVLVIPAAWWFPNLRSLELQNLQYLKKLVIKEGAMQQLSSLRIESCGSLDELTIPDELYQRLKKKKKKAGGDGYLVVPSRCKLHITGVLWSLF